MRKYLVLLFLSFIIHANELNIQMNQFKHKNSKTIHHKLNKEHISYNLSNFSDSKNYDKCFNEAGLHYNVSPKLLKAIAHVESKMNPDAIGVNHNGTYDVGIMQINSSWFPELAKVGIQRGELLDGCKNIQVGAWILSQNIKRYGLTANAIGRYNSSSTYFKNLYAYKVLKSFKEQDS